MTAGGRLQRLLVALPRRAIAHSGWLTAGNAAAQVGTLLAAVVVGRQLGRADLGRYATALAIGSIVVAGPGAGLPGMMLRDAAAGRVGRRYVARAIRGELALTGLATVVATVIGAAVIGGRNGAALGLLAGLANMALVQLSLAVSVGIGMQRHSLVVAAQVLLGLTLPVLVVLAVRWDLGVRGALAGHVVAVSAAAVLAFWRQRAHVRSLADGADTEGLMWRSKSFLGLGAANVGYERVDSVVLLSAGGAQAAGLYASAYRFLGPFALLQTGFTQVFYARLSGLAPGSPQWEHVRARGRQLYCLSVIPLALAAMAAMPFLVVTVFGPSFAGAVTPGRILMASVVPKALYWPEALALVSTGREAKVLYLVLFSVALDAALVVVLAGPLGAAGAAWAWVTTECALLATVHVLRRSGRERAEVGAA